MRRYLIMLCALLWGAAAGCSEPPSTQAQDLGWTIHDPCQGQRPCIDASIDLATADMAQDQALPPNMAIIPEGPFVMGTSSEINPNTAFFGEAPTHEVYLSKYAIDIYEVSVEDYKRCVDQGACTTPTLSQRWSELCNWEVQGREDHPINCVDWFQARTYCQWAGKRLPTEAQWEKAARGPESTIYPWGNEPFPSCDLAILSETYPNFGCGTGSTWPVGSRPKGASVYGVMDLIGNVEEWTHDVYKRDYYSVEPTPKDPQGPPEGNVHVPRGAGFISSPSLQFPYSSARDKATLAELISPTVGIRCAKDL